MRFVAGALLAVLSSPVAGVAADGFENHSLAAGEQTVATVVAFSPDGKWLAAGFGIHGLNGHQVGIWEVATRTRVATLRTPGRMENRRLAFSPDGSKLALGAADAIWMCKAENGWADSQPQLWWRPPAAAAEAPPRKPKPRTPTLAGINSVAVTPDGKQLAWGHGACTFVSPLELPDKAERLHTGVSNSAAFTPDGALLVLGGSVVEGQAKAGFQVWDCLPLRRRQAFPLGATGVCAAALAPSGKRVASIAAARLDAGSMVELRLWDLASGQSLVLARAPRLWVFAAFSPDSRTLAVPLLGPPSEAVLWDVATGKIRERLRHPAGQGVDTVAFSPDGRYLATGLKGGDDPVWLWSLKKPESPGRE